MSKILRRTSITIDEAVSILLGRTSGPVEGAPVNGTEDPTSEEFTYDLMEYLADEHEVLEGECDLAKYEGQPQAKIDEHLEALRKHGDVIERANAYLSAIDDELNNGELSELRVDQVLSNRAYTFITLHSFNAWAKKFGKRVLVDLPISTVESIDPAASPTPKNISAPRIRMREQEKAILAAIKELGYEPLELPRTPPGKSGIKSAIQKALETSRLFDGTTTSFNKAWERLRKDKSIAEK